MRCHDGFIITAVIVSMLASLVYLGLALYFLFDSARSDRLMFATLVMFTVECTLWTFNTIQFLCHSKYKAAWHLKNITLPLWDLILVLAITAVTLQIFCSLDVQWVVFADLPVGYQVAICLVCAIVPLKVGSAIVLTEFYHRDYVKRALIPPLVEFEHEFPPTAPRDYTELPQMGTD